ncbi:O-Glycosyl hydrolase [Actinacidiphila yanglinensis]|uniref:galactosylceramidase n=1 Tax=Actinacidiphila yanglinensis TaxID=310779 RepID=A0A1H5ZBU8_9ACTN|nr:ricin-type beta-trefoil lectin domain protein [Actinacidiphila yanglinensis]SEG33771.1 O-Glycosyl hydrolase [Actinacidiphila yanglinensis]
MARIGRLAPVWVIALLAALLAVGVSPAHAAASTTITVDGSKGGRTFDGIGAISGGGGNSRLLTDYPAAQQSQILDYLFTPDYGADLQILKAEIGGDANSTDGSEPSIEHSKGTVNCNAGYEFWLMKQAKARNPAIKLYGLAWAAPGWISGGFWSTDTINYLISWLGCAKQDGLSIDYLGGWNERGHDVNWYIQLRSALNAAGYSGVQIVGDDSGWGVADDMASNSAFNNAVQVIGAHYPCQGGDGGNADTCSSTANAKNNGKPLWASENGSLDMNSGAPALIRSITRGYVDADMTAYLNWPLVAAIYPNLPYATVGLATAGSPWSGNYSIGENTWATAQVTQFAQPGWTFIDSASGYLNGAESNGSYVTLKSPNGKDYSTVLETTTATAAQTATFTVQGGLGTGAVHVWATDVNHPSSATDFVHTQDITPAADGTYSLTMQPGYIYTASTTTGQGKGTATAPAAHALALPYSDNFDNDATSTEATYLSDMQGSYEVQPCASGRSGQCVQQMAPVKPIEWQDDSDAYSLIGDPTWSNYTVSSDVDLRQAGTVELLGRANTQNRPQSHQAAYEVRLSDSGAWSIAKNTSAGNLSTLASGTHASIGLNTWHTLSLGFSGDQITAKLDGATLGTVADNSYQSGQVGIGVVGYQTDQFDNLSVTPNAAGNISGFLKDANSGLCADVTGLSQNNNTPVELWDCNGGANQSWTATPAKQLQVSGTKCLDAAAAGTANGTAVQIYDCNGTAAQQWTVNADGSVVNTGSGKCLDATGGSTATGTLLELWDCNGGANQTWARGNTTGPLKGEGSGRCVDVPAASQDNGTKPALWDCNGANNQAWTSTATDQLTVYDTKCLEVIGAGTTDGTGVQINACNGSAAQQWRVRADGTVVNTGSGKCLDVTGAGTADNTPLEIWTCNGGSNQSWSRT